MKGLIKNERAQAGIGTLIIFIAMVLVAAVAAAVLIQTSGVMQAKSVTASREAAASIGENINVQAVDGLRPSASATTLSDLNLTIKVASGGSDIDLSKVLVKVQSQDKSLTYNYSTTTANTSNVFLVYVLRQESGELGASVNAYSNLAMPALKTGGLARLDINISSMSITQKTSITVSLLPEKGTAISLPLTLPAFSGTNIAIYP